MAGVTAYVAVAPRPIFAAIRRIVAMCALKVRICAFVFDRSVDGSRSARPRRAAQGFVSQSTIRPESAVQRVSNAIRVVPHDLDAERSVLGAILLVNDTFIRAADVVDASDFFRDAHRRIFNAMVALNEHADAIDLVTLKDALARSGELDAAGGPAYIARLVDGVPRATNVEHYARIIREKAALRAVIENAQAAVDAAYAGELPPERVDALQFALASSTKRESGRVAEMKARERDRREAFRQLDAEERGPVPVPVGRTLDHWLVEPDDEQAWRIEGWLTQGARALLVAQFKAGKTTAVLNLIRSLVDGDPWLGRHGVTKIDGAVALFDFEMSEPQLKRWLRDQQIEHSELVKVYAQRGKAAAFNILDPKIRSQWAEELRAAGTTFLVVDCLKPILDALGLDEHREVGRLLSALDALLVEAAIPGCVLVQHMGHRGEHARGDSTLMGWPDAIWTLLRKPADDPAAPRFIKAYGRDVDLPEAQLAFDDSTRRFTIAEGSGTDARRAAASTRAEAKREAATKDRVAQAINLRAQYPDWSLTQIVKAIGGRKADTLDAIRHLFNDAGTKETPVPAGSGNRSGTD
jgi:hypothetical protein